MNVLYLHQYFQPPQGAGGIRSYLNAREWLDVGVSVTMLTSPAGLPADAASRGEVIQELADEGLHVVVVGPTYSSKMGTFGRLTTFVAFALLATLWVLRNVSRYDVVFATSTPLTIAIPAMAGRLMGRPWVLEVRDVWPEMPIAAGRLSFAPARWAARALELAAYRSASSVVALSPGMQDSILRARPSTQVMVVPNYSDVRPVESVRAHLSAEVDARIQVAREAGRKVLSYVGSLNWLNGLDDLLEMARSDVEHRFHFLVAGDGSERARLIERVRSMGIRDDHVSFLPKVPYSEALAVFEASDLSLCLFRPIPEMEANSANKLFASLSVGTPVAINYGGWQAELMTGPVGIRLDTRDPAHACQQVEHFLTAHDSTTRRSASLHLASSFSPSKGATTILTALRRTGRASTGPNRNGPIDLLPVG